MYYLWENYYKPIMVASSLVVKNRLSMQEMRVRSLGREDPLEYKMATRSSILARRSAWTEKPGGLQTMGSQTAGLD